MIDSFTKKPIQVGDDDDAGPYIVVQLDQLGLVTKLLDDAGYRYDVDEEAISFNDGPYATIVNLGRHAGRPGHPKTARRTPGPQNGPPKEITEWPSAIASWQVVGKNGTDPGPQSVAFRVASPVL